MFAFRFVKKKFEELYFQSTTPDRVDRVFKIYRTTALDQKLVKKTFKLVDETLRRRNLFEAGLLWPGRDIFLGHKRLYYEEHHILTTHIPWFLAFKFQLNHYECRDRF